MPCSGPGGPTSDEEARMLHYRDEMDKVTRLLCSLCRSIEKRHTAEKRGKTGKTVRSLITDSKDLADWWKEHQKLDAARIKKERHVRQKRLTDLRRTIQKAQSELAALENEPIS